ncbi:NADPH-dependent F420 reductase [Variovorax sp. PCZ-1]|uniref:NADPH-dependent F420 reductase n=1 Tax=Variovorax sp. PCZ-1 TaxID=2835533 RepID=UPI001BD0B651|nr:NADPH-dependent F420 reductase [Variovorax sp. PCZ-1]MBS7807791.1 NADPH-dependent F420 reductase [Variovorax sp. PCZ-1]
MKITVIGAGNMGAGFVKQLHAAGHSVKLASRDAAKSAALAAKYPGVQHVPAQGAAADAEVVVLAVGYGDAPAALASLGDLSGKVVIDITNPLSADYMSLTVGHSTSAAEQIAQAAPKSHVVKAFNTLFAAVLDDGANFSKAAKVSVFVAGNNDAAKQTVKQLATSMGFDAVDAGGLNNARYLEPLAGLNVYFGYGAGQGTGISPAWIRKS